MAGLSVVAKRAYGTQNSYVNFLSFITFFLCFFFRHQIYIQCLAPKHIYLTPLHCPNFFTMKSKVNTFITVLSRRGQETLSVEI
jgi:hypothetical protein